MLLICYGTRPEHLKLKPLFKEMTDLLPYKTLFTGQHNDIVHNRADYVLKIDNGRNRLDSIVSSIMNSINFQEEGITSVMVQGDTTTSLAMALTAFNHNIPFIHL